MAWVGGTQARKLRVGAGPRFWPQGLCVESAEREAQVHLAQPSLSGESAPGRRDWSRAWRRGRRGLRGPPVCVQHAAAAPGRAWRCLPGTGRPPCPCPRPRPRPLSGVWAPGPRPSCPLDKQNPLWAALLRSLPGPRCRRAPRAVLGAQSGSTGPGRVGLCPGSVPGSAVGKPRVPEGRRHSHREPRCTPSPEQLSRGRRSARALSAPRSARARAVCRPLYRLSLRTCAPHTVPSVPCPLPPASLGQPRPTLAGCVLGIVQQVDVSSHGWRTRTLARVQSNLPQLSWH